MLSRSPPAIPLPLGLDAVPHRLGMEDGLVVDLPRICRAFLPKPHPHQALGQQHLRVAALGVRESQPHVELQQLSRTGEVPRRQAPNAHAFRHARSRCSWTRWRPPGPGSSRGPSRRDARRPPLTTPPPLPGARVDPPIVAPCTRPAGPEGGTPWHRAPPQPPRAALRTRHARNPARPRPRLRTQRPPHAPEHTAPAAGQAPHPRTPTRIASTQSADRPKSLLLDPLLESLPREHPEKTEQHRLHLVDKPLGHVRGPWVARHGRERFPEAGRERSTP